MRHFGGDRAGVQSRRLTDERRPREVVSALEWAEIRALASDGVSQRQISDADWASHGANLDRVLRVKARYDPDDTLGAPPG